MGWVQELGRHHDPRPLPARPRARGDGRPRRDPAVVGGPGLPDRSRSTCATRAGWPSAHRCSRTTSWPTRTTPRSCCGASATSCRSPAAARPRRATSPARPRSPSSSTPPARSAMAVSDWPGVACQSAYAPLDVIGVNEYFGWFDAGGGADDDRDALGPFLDTRPRLLSDQGDHGHRVRLRRPTATARSRSAAPTPSRPTRSPSTSTCSPASPGCPARSTSRCRTSWPSPDCRGATRGPIRRSCTRVCSTSPAAPKPAFGVVSPIYHATRQIAP